MKKILKPNSLSEDPLSEVSNFHARGDAIIQKIDDTLPETTEAPEHPADLSQKSYERFEKLDLEVRTNSISHLTEFRYSERNLSGTFGKIEIENLLAAFMGSKHPVRRPYPSAGAQYPCNIYFIIKRSEDYNPGVYYLDLFEGKLVQIFAMAPHQFSSIGIYEESKFNAAAYLIVTGQLFRSTNKYGVRGYRYCLLEGGIVTWQANLVLEEIGKRSVWIGGFDDKALANSIGIRPEIEKEYPLIALGIGN